MAFAIAPPGLVSTIAVPIVKFSGATATVERAVAMTTSPMLLKDAIARRTLLYRQ